MRYDPKQYWEDRPNPNAKGHDQAPKFIYDFIGPAIKGYTSILELGPGLGRTFDVYKPEQKITTLDLSTRYKDIIEERAKAFGLTVDQNFLDAPDAPFPFEDKAFEIGMTVQVLMHVPPAHIETSIRELIRTSHECVVVTSVGPAPGTKPSHVFTHDYDGLFTKLGATIVEKDVRTNTVLMRTKNS
jgi:hypothetical protein